MDVRLLYPTKYIKAADLQGKDVTLTISRVEPREELKSAQGTDYKPALYFKEMEERNARGQGENKRLVLNKTNATTIAGIHGNETDNWVGKKVTLFPTTTRAGGKTVDCVRVRDK